MLVWLHWVPTWLGAAPESTFSHASHPPSFEACLQVPLEMTRRGSEALMRANQDCLSMGAYEHLPVAIGIALTQISHTCTY